MSSASPVRSVRPSSKMQYDDLDVAPLDDLSELRPEVREAIERAEERLVAGTARLVAHDERGAVLDEIRRQQRG